MEMAFVPLYIKYLGIEAFGIIGVFALLQGWLALLDAGMTPTLSREMARFTGGAHNPQSIRNLLRSIEIIALSIALFIAVSLWGVSDWLASDWLKAEKLSPEIVSQAFVVMGVIVALRFIENIYRSSIIGLQKQVALNVINSVMATLKGLGSVGILIWISPTLEAFFIWQGVVSIITVSIFAFTVYKALPPANSKGQFSIDALRGIWKYASGMLAITFLGLLLTQVDKIILSKLLTLEEFGYYVLAALVASALFILVAPISQAFFPHFSKLVARDEQIQLIQNYHKAAQLVTVILGSVAVFLIFFAEPILLLWTQNTALAEKSALLVVPLALGNLLNGLMWIPYQTQLAYGWTSLTIKINILAVTIIIPTILWLTPLYGAIAAAWIWVFINAGYILFGVHFMYRKILSNEKWRWYTKDILFPMTSATITAFLLSWIAPSSFMSTFTQLAWLFFTLVTILLSSAVATLTLRTKILSFIRRIRINSKLL